MSDTPIFDQLTRELNYARMIASAKTVPAYTGTSTKVMGIMAPGMYIDEWNGGQTDEVVNADSQTQAVDFVHKSYADFRRDHPEAVITGMRTEVDEDGEVKIVIEGAEPIPVTTLAELAEGTHQE